MRIIKYFAINTAFALSLYFGFFGGVEQASNIAYFIAWFKIIVSFLTVSDTVVKEMKKKGRVIPGWFDAAFDFAVIVVFVWVGAWVTAAFYLFHSLLVAGAWQRVERELNEE